MASDVEISKFMSLVLRHAPEKAGLVLDDSGWTDFERLCTVLTNKFKVSRADILRLIETNPKKRFTLDGNRIRAAQGHSVEVDLALAPVTPPPLLYHGTKQEFLASIMEEGLVKRSRQHVHLSKDTDTAHIVARRRKGPDVILRVDSASMAKDGAVFFHSENGVWLTDTVAPRYLTVLATDDLT